MLIRKSIYLALIASTFFVTPTRAEQGCWPVDQVVAAHARQGDDIILTFRSRVREGVFTVIYRDPADGVIVEITMYPNGEACVVDVGEAAQFPTRDQQTLLRGGH